MSNITLNAPDGRTFSAGKIVCVGRNYAKHAAELNNALPAFPLIFLKPFSGTVFSGDYIVHPDYSSNLHHEVELTILISEKARNLSKDDAGNVIAGYGVGLDLTLRDLQDELKKKGEPWTLAKCFDTCAVLSDFVKPAEGTLNLNRNISLMVNNVLRQSAPLNEMIFKPADIISYISHKMTLEPGDVIFTGTPEGVGKLERGDKLLARIEGVASLTTEVH